MRVYISGKIGENWAGAATREKFAKAEAYLKALGHTIFNPTTSGLGESAEALRILQVRVHSDGDYAQCYMLQHYEMRSWYSGILLLDLDELSWCDAICLLPDWRQSPGARVELAYAQAIGLKIYELSQYQTLIEWK